jgi:hypothetical protein
VRRIVRASGVGRIRLRSKATGDVVITPEPGRITWTGQQVMLTTTRVKRRGGRPPKYDLEHWQAVAQIYRDASAQSNRKPTRSVARHFKVTESAAAKWVAKCRDLGLLPKTTRGKVRAGDAVATPATVRAVASVPAPTVIATAGTGRAVKAKQKRRK